MPQPKIVTHHKGKKSIIEADAEGVRYSVEIGGYEVWHRYVAFGHDHRHRAGGPAFVEAAREQDQIVGLRDASGQLSSWSDSC